MASKRQRARFATREDAINAVKKKPIKGFGRFLAVMEFKKVTAWLGSIEGELFMNDKMVFRGGITVQTDYDDNFDWRALRTGQSSFTAVFLDVKGVTTMQIVKNIIVNYIKQGKIPFLR